MADIVQLEEKGTVLYPKTHISAIDNFDEFKATVVKKTGDETIAGIKNFKDGIQIDGKELNLQSPIQVGAWKDWDLGTSFQKYDDSINYKPMWRIVTINGLSFLQSKGIVKWKGTAKGSAKTAYPFVKHGNTIPYMYEIPVSCLENGVSAMFSLGRDGATSINASGEWTGIRLSFFAPIFS